jgi:outer membrane protein TolC
MESRREFFEIEGLGQIVVGAGADPIDAIAHLAARGEHDDRNFGEPANHRQERQSVDFGQHHVEHDAVGLPHPYEREPLDAVAGAADLEAFESQGDFEHFADTLIVVDDGDSPLLLIHRIILRLQAPAPPRDVHGDFGAFLGSQRSIVRQTAAHGHLAWLALDNSEKDRQRTRIRSWRGAQMMAVLVLAAIVIPPAPATSPVSRTNVAQAAPQTNSMPAAVAVPSALPSVESGLALPYPAYGLPQPQILTARPAAGVPATVALADAIAIAIARVPSLAAARGEVALEDASVALARTGLAPDVSISGSSGYSYVQGGGGSTAAASAATASNLYSAQSNSGSLSLSQLIYDGGQIRAKIDAASLTRDATLATYRRDAQTVVYNVAAAYYTLLADERTVAVDEELLRENIVSENLVRAQIRAGTVAGADLSTQLATTANARTTLVTAQGTLQNDRVAFATDLGLPADTDVLPRDDTQGLETATPASALPAFASALDIAYAERPDVVQARLTVAADEASLRGARRGLSPTLSFSGTKGIESSNLGGGAIRNDGTLGFSVTIPIYDQGVTRANVASSRATVAIATANAATTRLTVAQDVRQALISIVSDRAVLDQTRAAYDSSVSSLRSTQGQYRVGASTLPSLIQAEATLASAATNIVNAIYTLRIAENNLRYALGTNLQ